MITAIASRSARCTYVTSGTRDIVGTALAQSVIPTDTMPATGPILIAQRLTAQQNLREIAASVSTFCVRWVPCQLETALITARPHMSSIAPAGTVVETATM